MDRPTTREHQSDPGRSHSGAVLEAKLRLLIDQLDRYGVLTRSELARLPDASPWREGGFESALRLGIQRGEIVVLPEDCVRAGTRRAALSTSGRGERSSADGRTMHREQTRPLPVARLLPEAGISGWSAAPDLQLPCSGTAKRGF
jgi:hypothetical protein